VFQTAGEIGSGPQWNSSEEPAPQIVFDQRIAWINRLFEAPGLLPTTEGAW
jgi:hypothetical protein